MSGKVVDAETKLPIKTFRVVPGIRSSESPVYWIGYESFTASDGHYRMRQRNEYFATRVRIEADGHRPAVSRNIASHEGSVTIDFELQPGKNIVAKVFTPRNLPAAGAKVSLAFGNSPIHLVNGDVPDGPAYCARNRRRNGPLPISGARRQLSAHHRASVGLHQLTRLVNGN